VIVSESARNAERCQKVPGRHQKVPENARKCQKGYIVV